MEESVVLIANIGSASKKYALYRRDAGGVFMLLTETRYELLNTDQEVYKRAGAYFLGDALKSGLIAAIDDVHAVLMRIVAPGTYFQKHRIMDDVYVAAMERAERIAPLHLRAQREVYDQLRALLPNAAFYGMSDSAFHATIPEYASAYAIAAEDAEKYDLRKFGYHGFATASAVARARALAGELPSRVVECHLGGGASVTAVKDGVSVDTSMGVTPLDGLIMATRCGTIDPGALLALMNARSFTPKAALEYLDTKSGLRGLGGSPDIPVLLEREEQGDARAARALDAYAYRVRHYIGAAMLALGGVDMIILSGTVSERSAPVRASILGGLTSLGIELDEEANTTLREDDGDKLISAEESPVKIAVVHIDEYAAMLDAYQNMQTR